MIESKFQTSMRKLRAEIAKGPVTLEVIEETLEKRLNTVCTAPLLFSNGAVAQAKEGKYDIIFSDLLEPNLRGKVFLHELFHIVYSEVSPKGADIETEAQYREFEALIGKQREDFIRLHPEFLTEIERRYI